MPARRFRRGAWIALALLAACAPVPSSPPVETEAPTAVPRPAPTSSPAPADPEPEAQATVSIWVAWGPAGVRSLNDRVRAFQSQRPAARFSLAYVPADELRQSLAEAAGSDRLPSLFLAPSSWGPELLQEGIIQELSGRPIDQIKPLLHSLAWAQVSQADQVLGLPVQLEGNVLYRNRELATVPAATVEGLVEASRGFRGTARVGINLDFGFATIVPFASACGGPIALPGVTPDLAAGLGLCWLSLLQELSLAGPVSFNTDDEREAFRSGLSGWLIDSTEWYETFSADLGEGAVAVDPWPIYEESGEPLAGYVWGESIYFRSGLQPVELELAWDLAAFLLSAESQQALSSPIGAGNLPVHAGSIPLVGVYGQMYQALVGGVPLPLEPPPPGVAEILERAARAVAVQGTPVEIALRRAIEELADV